MAKRILNMTAEEMTHATRKELIEAIAGSEGRVLASETIGITIPLLTDVTNAEFAASMGADLILLNMFDVQNPKIMALPEVEKEETVREVKRLTGRMVGINLEPVEENYASDNKETLWEMSAGRYATVENAVLAEKMGVDLLVLTGNPGNGVSNPAIIASLKAISEAVGDKKELVEGDPIVYSAVHQVTFFHRNEVFCKEIEKEIHQPAPKELQVGELGVIQLGKPEVPVINHWFRHEGLPP